MIHDAPSAAALEQRYTVLDLLSLRPRILDRSGLLEEFDRLGLLVFPGFFSTHELLAARKAMDAHYAPLHHNALLRAKERLEKEHLKDHACDVIPWDPVGEGNAPMRDLHDHHALAALTQAILGSGFTSLSSLVMFSIGGGRGQAWHQDCPSDARHVFNLNRLIYPDDVSLEDGAIIAVPGSHRRGRIPPGGPQESMEGELVLTPRAGTLILLHGHVYHRVTPNLNQKPRTSINFRAFPAGVSSDVTCIGVFRDGTVNFCDKPE